MPSFTMLGVIDDNPYSDTFTSIDNARRWVQLFVSWCNNEYRHSGTKYATLHLRHYMQE